MSSTDLRGNPVSTRDPKALARFEKAQTLFHGYYGDPLGEIGAALAESPDFVMGYCLRAGLWLSSTEKAAEPMLRADVEAAEALAGRANERERAHVAAARAWLDGDFERSVWLYGGILDRYPRDALALQIAHLGDFYLGQSAALRDRIARVLPYWDRTLPGYGYVLGMHAFGLEECGDYGAAEATGRLALELNRRDPWAVHAVAHVMEMQGRPREGIEWLESRAPDWAPDNAFAFHNWWHLALYYLDQGAHDKVLELYDRCVRPGDSRVVLEMVDATAMLWRLRLRGVDAGARWTALADAWEPLASEGYYAFNDMHAMMAFVAADRPRAARALLAAQAARVEHPGTNAMMTWAVGLPVCQALEAFGRQDWARCIELLAPVRHVAHRFGGSHAQRDVLALTLLEAALRGGNRTLADKLAAERLRARPASPFNLGLVARARALARPPAPDRAGARPYAAAARPPAETVS